MSNEPCLHCLLSSTTCTIMRYCEESSNGIITKIKIPKMVVFWPLLIVFCKDSNARMCSPWLAFSVGLWDAILHVPFIFPREQYFTGKSSFYCKFQESCVTIFPACAHWEREHLLQTEILITNPQLQYTNQQCDMVFWGEYRSSIW